MPGIGLEAGRRSDAGSWIASINRDADNKPYAKTKKKTVAAERERERGPVE